MKLSGLLVGAAALALCAGGAFAQGPQDLHCLVYRGMDGSNAVEGAIVRTANPSIWIESNSENTGTHSWQQVSQNDRGITLFDPSRGYTLRISARHDDIQIKLTPQDNFQHFYDIAFAE
jgi:hypothetical protein